MSFNPDAHVKKTVKTGRGRCPVGSHGIMELEGPYKAEMTDFIWNANHIGADSAVPKRNLGPFWG